MSDDTPVKQHRKDEIPPSLDKGSLNDGLNNHPGELHQPTDVGNQSDMTGDTPEEKVTLSFSLKVPKAIGLVCLDQLCGESDERSGGQICQPEQVSEVSAGAVTVSTITDTIDREQNQARFPRARTKSKVNLPKVDAFLVHVPKITSEDERIQVASRQWCCPSQDGSNDEAPSLENVASVVKRTLCVITAMTKEIDNLTANLRRLDERLELAIVEKSWDTDGNGGYDAADCTH